ncbi:MAG: hypothetical protein FWF29_02585 [Treponema sp.]|nr:hypothetical protein [Treponema sp.]
MKKFIVILAVVAAVFMISGCASIYSASTTSISGAQIDKIGQATNIVWFGLFGTYNYPPAAQVAKDNGIKKIAFVDRYYKVGVFALWIEYTTVVTGE